MTDVEDAILLYLRYMEAQSITELAGEIRFHRATVVLGVRRLVNKGFVFQEKGRIRLTWEGTKQIDYVLIRTFSKLQYCRRRKS